MIEIIHHRWTARSRPDEGSPLIKYIEHPVDLVFADPPYNYKVAYDGDPTKDDMAPLVYEQWVEYVIFQLKSMIRDGGMLFWLCPSEQGKMMWNILSRYGTLLYGCPVVWHERFSQYQPSRLTKDYRLLFPVVIGTGPITFNPNEIREESERQRLGDKRADPRGRVPGHVWLARRLQGTARDRVDWHPAQLPPEPLERIVLGWTNPGDTVMDAFAGSGSLGMVCKRHERRFIGIDGSEKYCEEMRRRLA